jgi:transposase
MVMRERADQIPNDLPGCQELLRGLLERLREMQCQLADLKRQLDETCATNGELQRSYDCLNEQYLGLKRLFFGPRRERLVDAPGQQRLFGTDGTALVAAQLASAGPTEEPTEPKRKGSHGRRQIPEHLPRTEVPHDVPPEARVCECGREKVRIGEDVSEQLDYVPGRVVVYRHVYPKYACSCCKDGVTSAPPAASPIERGMAGPGLLAYIVVNKFSDHLPTYRQQDIFARHGIFLARSTLCDWLAQCAQGLRPLVELMRRRVLKSLVINADETPVSVLDPTRDSTRTGYFWTYIGSGSHPYTIYDYRDSRSRDGPAKILKDFRGYLQTDAYASYESVVLDSDGRIIPVGCWAHARREFFDARLNEPRGAHYVIGLVAQLYDIEDEIRLQSPEARLAARQERSVPILDRLEVFLREQRDSALPKSQYGKAITYALNHWPELRRFTESAVLEIDNNIAERTLRLCAIGRKNWLFVGSDRGGETAATCLSILAGAKRHRIEPFAYVRDLLVAISAGEVDWNMLLPDAWIAAHPEHVLNYRRDEAEAAANARRRRRSLRRKNAKAANVIC